MQQIDHILDILRDEQYLGTYVAGKTKVVEVGGPRQATNTEENWIRILNHRPAIISQELFDAAQEQLRMKDEPLRRRCPLDEKLYYLLMRSGQKRKRTSCFWATPTRRRIHLYAGGWKAV
ncbi:MAG: recombinase family protein [Christensenellaceae bacterium]|jgi:hypothetical protein|nr:recombinase family protein [Christensenellaceae bacterium]